ncbi:MAG: phage Gp37/Gp68 family protein [Stagnimonas sp.]|nr:phage Gp37/Gp68 family protein [Stagnimonas sp.]
MTANTEISWTNHTFNPVWGCDKVSPGCQHCYAEGIARRFGTAWGPDAVRREFGDDHWGKPVDWNKAAEKVGVPALVFCASMADVFDKNWPAGVRERLWALIEATPWLRWQLLTKRIGNASRMVPERWMREGFPANVWMGASFVNQEEWNRDADKLLALPAKLHFGSFEPLLGWIDPMECPDCEGSGETSGHYFSDTGLATCERCSGRGVRQYFDLGWVIVGGESGRQARPMHPDWARDIRAACIKAGTPFHFKQWGHWLPHPEWPAHPHLPSVPVAPKRGWMVLDQSGRLDVPDGYFPEEHLGLYAVAPVGKEAAGRQLDGREWNEFPNP